MPATILVFDDEPATLQVVKEVLEDESYSVITTSSLREAQHIIDTRKVDLFLSDSEARTRTQAVEQYQHYGKIIGSKVPIVIFTTHRLDQQEALTWGCRDLLLKPFELGELVQVVKRNLNTPPCP